MIAFSICLYVCALLYALVLFQYGFGFVKVIRKKQPRNTYNYPTVSILVPARNEAQNIQLCLTTILNNDYPIDKFEVIVLDDLSEDDTAKMVHKLEKRFNKSFVRLKMLRIEQNSKRDIAHKKFALSLGVAQASGEIIMTTDADCVVPKDWIKNMTRMFEKDVAFVSGPVRYHVGRSLYSKLLSLEFMGLVGMGAGAIGINQPNMCNGANVAYRKQVFLEGDGYEGINTVSSGDDELLMQKIFQKKLGRIVFCNSSDAIVKTDHVTSFRDFINQRKRWSSKGRIYKDKKLVAKIGLIFLFQCLLLVSFVLLPFYPALFIPIGFIFSIKFLAELSLLIPATHFFKQKRLLFFYPLLQLLQIPYIVLIGLLSSSPGYTWKNRTIEQ